MADNLTIKISKEVKSDLDKIRNKLLSEYGVEALSMSSVVAHLIKINLGYEKIIKESGFIGSDYSF